MKIYIRMAQLRFIAVHAVRLYSHAVHKTARSDRCCSDIARLEKNVILEPHKGTGGLTETNKRNAPLIVVCKVLVL